MNMRYLRFAAALPLACAAFACTPAPAPVTSNTTADPAPTSGGPCGDGSKPGPDEHCK